MSNNPKTPMGAYFVFWTHFLAVFCIVTGLIAVFMAHWPVDDLLHFKDIPLADHIFLFVSVLWMLQGLLLHVSACDVSDLRAYFQQRIHVLERYSETESNVYNDYKAWCSLRKTAAMTHEKFSKAFEEVWPYKKRVGGESQYSDIALIYPN